MMEDVERIEVISGPGGTQWGSNAVNGVISVITRAAGDTQGNLAMAGGGNLDSGAAYRHGGELAGGGNYRSMGAISTARIPIAPTAAHRSRMPRRAGSSGSAAISRGR